jgi:hypothetical protein
LIILAHFPGEPKSTTAARGSRGVGPQGDAVGVACERACCLLGKGYLGKDGWTFGDSGIAALTVAKKGVTSYSEVCGAR